MAFTTQELDKLRRLLDAKVLEVNTPAFVSADPIQFPRRYTRLHDVEAVAMLASTIAWGRRTMICSNCERMLALMQPSPYDYIMNEGYEALDDALNIHRTFFARDFKYMLRGLRRVFSQHGSLEGLAAHCKAGDSPEPAWQLATALQSEMAAANGGALNSRCLPTHLGNTALKRFNMALRWLVRNDGIVDLGVWTVIKPSQLFIPLDVHVRDTAHALGLTSRRSPDKKAVLEITSVLRQLRPADPVVYDFALFGIGINGQSTSGS